VVEAVAATDKTHSRYARALANAIDYLVAAGDLFDGRLSPEEAKGRFDVGVPELSLQD
jgi:DNA repair exonuclease SbcCD nuclease subunit